jgi:hypothetical protein
VRDGRVEPGVVFVSIVGDPWIFLAENNLWVDRLPSAGNPDKDRRPNPKCLARIRKSLSRSPLVLHPVAFIMKAIAAELVPPTNSLILL